MPPNPPSICFSAVFVTRMARQAGVERRDNLGMRGEAVQQVSKRSARMRARAGRASWRPRIREKGLERMPRMSPCALRMSRTRWKSASARANPRAPAMTSEWPLRYLVAECMTTSAPSAMGRVKIGVAQVECGDERARRVGELCGFGDVAYLPRADCSASRARRASSRPAPHRAFEFDKILGIDESTAEPEAGRVARQANCAAPST